MTSGKQGKKNRSNKKNRIPITSSRIQNSPSLESVENSEELAHDKIEEKNPIDELNLTVKTLKESIDEIRIEQKSKLEELNNRRDSDMERLENQQKLILEELQKLNKADEEKKPSFNSVIFPGSLVKNTSSNGIPPVGRSFVLKHVFENVSKMGENKQYYNNEEEHFGIPWSMFVIKKEENLEFYLQCNKSLETEEKWAVDTKFTLQFIGMNEKWKSSECEKVYGNYDGNKKFTATGREKFISLEELKKDYLIDDKLTAEIYVKINKMTGVYKEKSRNFDESVKECSDVILKIGNEKFYVAKLFLSFHSTYFKTLFLGQFQESKQYEIKLSGIKPEDFQNFLEVLYGDPSIDEVTVEGILLVADMYDTSIVIGKCEDFLLEKSQKSTKKKFQMSTRYHLDKLKAKCMSEIKTKDDIISVIPGKLEDLEPSIMAKLFAKSLALQ